MLATENVQTLSEVAAQLPGNIHPSTLWRWCRRGLRGIKLESRALGGRTFTSVEAVDRFSEKLAALPPCPRRGGRRGKATP